MRVFDKDSPSGEIILQWWNDLKRSSRNRANLRRCNTPSETVFLPVSQILISKLKESEDIPFKLSSDKICAIAGILSHVKENIPINFARHLSQKKSGSEQSLVSDIRFRRILQFNNISEDELFFQRIIRVVHHIDYKANIYYLFSSLYFWGDKVKKQWAYDYYGTASTNENETEEQYNLITQGANNE